MTPTQQNERFFSLLESPVMNGKDKLNLISLFLSLGEKEQGEFLDVVEAYKDEEEEMRNILRERFEFVHGKYEEKRKGIKERVTQAIAAFRARISEEERPGRVLEMKQKILES